VINFVSNLPEYLRSGGFSAMNVAALAAVRKFGEVRYIGPINPPADWGQKLLSKLLRSVGMRGRFFFFSKERLRLIADLVREKCAADATIDFYHGFTPWILTEPSRRYMAWSDCTFSDYIRIYHRAEQFSARDIERIAAKEGEWLRKAAHVAFTSDWAAKRAIQDYGLAKDKVSVVGIFGEMQSPEQDAYSGRKQFCFVSTNFKAKGGPVVLTAFRSVRARHPDASLVIVGDKPDHGESEQNVTVTGFLRKENAQDCQTLTEILSQSRAIVHPTKSDIAPLIIVEAGYFGCPAISVKRFAIPELVDSGNSGILIEDPDAVEQIADAMAFMLEQEERYLDMRRAAWTLARERHSREAFESRLISCLQT